MQDIIIKSCNLGKKYQIRHEGHEGSATIRDLIVNSIKGVLQPGQRASKEEFWALQDINIEINRGDRIGIIGRNGSGKSTLLKIMSRITAPTTGYIDIKGRTASLLEVGTGFHPELTGRENIYLSGAILGMTRSEINRQFNQIVEFADIEQFIDTPVKRYSSGMYIRLAFSIMAHLDSDILMVDEVLAVGDGQFQRKCLEKMRTIGNSGRTILFVSHNMAYIQSFCDKCILLEKGRLRNLGQTEMIVQDYLNSLKIDCTEINDLLNHPNRVANMKRLLKKVSFYPEGGLARNKFYQNENITIQIEYNSFQHDINKVGIAIFSEIGIKVATIDSFMYSRQRKSFPKNGVLKFIIFKAQLNIGLYHINISLKNTADELLDMVEYAADFEILPADIYNTGRITQASDGIVTLGFDMVISSLE